MNQKKAFLNLFAHLISLLFFSYAAFTLHFEAHQMPVQLLLYLLFLGGYGAFSLFLLWKSRRRIRSRKKIQIVTHFTAASLFLVVFVTSLDVEQVSPIEIGGIVFALVCALLLSVTVKANLKSRY